MLTKLVLCTHVCLESLGLCLITDEMFFRSFNRRHKVVVALFHRITDQEEVQYLGFGLFDKLIMQQHISIDRLAIDSITLEVIQVFGALMVSRELLPGWHGQEERFMDIKLLPSSKLVAYFDRAGNNFALTLNIVEFKMCV